MVLIMNKVLVVIIVITYFLLLLLASTLPGHEPSSAKEPHQSQKVRYRTNLPEKGLVSQFLQCLPWVGFRVWVKGLGFRILALGLRRKGRSDAERHQLVVGAILAS